MRLIALRDLTRFEQTLFGLPFILSGVILGSYQHFDWKKLPFVICAFMLARISGMSFNQLIDRHIDKRNARTQHRAIPSGKISAVQAGIVAWLTWVLFIIVCLQINTLTALLSILAAMLIYLYSYMKRVHASCHGVLASIHFLGAVMAFTATTGTCNLSALFLGGAAALSILGSDIIYAIQDYEFDLSENLFSIPSRLGIEKSLYIARIAHGLCVSALFCVGWTLAMPLIYYLNLPCVAAAFGYFHYLAHKQWKASTNFREIEPHFFWCNVTVSGSSLVFIFIGRVWGVLL